MSQTGREKPFKESDNQKRRHGMMRSRNHWVNEEAKKAFISA